MGVRNYLVEGVSCSGKTTVATELEHRGHHVVHGDRVLAYQGDPVTGEPLPGHVHVHEHHVWDVAEVRRIAADRSTPATFFCGGSRNFARFIELFDEVFVLEVDRATLVERLAARPADEWGGDPEETSMVLRLHESREDVPANGVVIESTRPLAEVVDEILRLASGRRRPGGSCR